MKPKCPKGYYFDENRVKCLKKNCKKNEIFDEKKGDCKKIPVKKMNFMIQIKEIVKN